ncbi:MAG: hypothetical protein IPJ77_07600 [Planctomycetes bacterium]|nr:hypothetical protein [Planctomycetota bacterium]
MLLALAASADERTAPTRDRSALRASTTTVDAPPAAPTPQALAALRAAPDEQVHFDRPGDGALWAAGTNWKMRFDAAGATWFPRLGPRAPRNVPFDFTPERVTVGGEELAFARGAAAERIGERVELDRGAFVEAYELDPKQIEQLFVFDRLPRAGELVLRIPATGEMEAVQEGGGLAFRSELGVVRYGRGTVIDARGHSAEIEPRFDDGAIVLRVGAEFLARAAWPVVIDPVISLIHVESTTSDTFSPDVAWDPTEQGWLVVYEQTYSATDTDIYAKFLSANGAVLLTGTVDFTTVAWHSPRCANLAAAQQFLVVAEVESGLNRIVKGRTIEPSGAIFVQSAQFDVSDASAGNKILPDVGGDPFPGEPSYYCVVWEQDVSSTDKRVAYRLVNSAAQVSTNVAFMASVPLTPDVTPSISKSNDTNEWLIAWTRSDVLYHGDIYAAHVRYDGLLVDGPFGVTSFGIAYDSRPTASSPMRGTRRSVIAYQRRQNAGSNPDIWATAFDGTTWLQTANVTAMENLGLQSLQQIEPDIDCDGEHFLLAYAETDTFYPTFFAVHVTDLFLAGNTIALSQPHQLLWNFGLSERRPQVSAQHSLGSSTHRFMALYDFEQNSQDHDVDGALFDSTVGGTWSLACPGDGTAAPCPCGNVGATGRGCANSVYSAGASLTYLDGRVATNGDTTRLRVDGVPSNVLCLFFQGTSEDPGVPFGDGVRCASGTLVRVGAHAATGNAATIPQPGDLPISQRGGVPPEGGYRIYQVWYRNAASYCTSATFNTANAVVLNWSR